MNESNVFRTQLLTKQTCVVYSILGPLLFLIYDRSSHWRCSVKNGVLRNFAKFTGKPLCQSFFFNKVASIACNFIKKETLALVFSCKFYETSKNTFFKEHLWATASIMLKVTVKVLQF